MYTSTLGRYTTSNRRRLNIPAIDPHIFSTEHIILCFFEMNRTLYTVHTHKTRMIFLLGIRLKSAFSTALSNFMDIGWIKKGHALCKSFK